MFRKWSHFYNPLEKCYFYKLASNNIFEFCSLILYNKWDLFVRSAQVNSVQTAKYCNSADSIIENASNASTANQKTILHSNQLPANHANRLVNLNNLFMMSDAKSTTVSGNSRNLMLPSIQSSYPVGVQSLRSTWWPSWAISVRLA